MDFPLVRKSNAFCQGLSAVSVTAWGREGNDRGREKRGACQHQSPTVFSHPPPISFRRMPPYHISLELRVLGFLGFGKVGIVLNNYTHN